MPATSSLLQTDDSEVCSAVSQGPCVAYTPVAHRGDLSHLPGPSPCFLESPLKLITSIQILILGSGSGGAQRQKPQTKIWDFISEVLHAALLQRWPLKGVNGISVRVTNNWKNPRLCSRGFMEQEHWLAKKGLQLRAVGWHGKAQRALPRRRRWLSALWLGIRTLEGPGWSGRRLPFHWSLQVAPTRLMFYSFWAIGSIIGTYGEKELSMHLKEKRVSFCNPVAEAIQGGSNR